LGFEKLAQKNITTDGGNEEMKWISLRLKQSEIEELDEKRSELVEAVGLQVSRSAYIRSIIVNTLDYNDAVDEVAR